MEKIISNSPEETIEYGKKLAANLKVGDVIVLTGDLGSGKTMFVKGFASSLGINENITSPTFNIVKEYASLLLMAIEAIAFPATKLPVVWTLIGTVLE